MVPEGFSLAGRNALITGSTRGIGAALAVALARAGAAVAVHGAGPCEGEHMVATRITESGGRAISVGETLGPEGSARRLRDAVVASLGCIDILVLNAAIQIPEPWEFISPEAVTHQFDTNYRSSLELIQLTVPAMQQRQWGRVLTVGSVQEARPHPEMAVYAALKAAQISLVRNLARQVAGSGVTVNNLAPGVILTNRNSSRLDDPAYRRRVLAAIPAARFGTPDDCAAAALLICSPAGSYITGQSLFVDGGMSL